MFVTSWPLSLPDPFGIFSAKLLEDDVELEAVHEIMVLFPSFSCSAELDEEERWDKKSVPF